MSKAAMQWARSIKIDNAPMTSVLRTLAYLHNEKVELFPSQQYLADETGLSVRAVRYALQLLGHFKLISRTARSNGAFGRTSDRFELHLDRNIPVTREMVLVAKNGLRKGRSNRHVVPVASANSQPAPCAGPPGTTCQGIGELTGLSHEGRYPRVELGTTREAGHAATALKVINGGRS